MPAQQFEKRNILVVDDDPLVRETVTMLLQADGYTVTPADSGQQALSLYEPGKYLVIFTDFFMPRMTGAALATAIKSQSADQRIVMLTAYPEKLRSQKEPLTQVDLLLCKPFEIEALRSAISSSPSV